MNDHIASQLLVQYLVFTDLIIVPVDVRIESAPHFLHLLQHVDGEFFQVRVVLCNFLSGLVG